MNKKQKAMSIPKIVAWVSPSFTPSKYKTLKVYAEIRQFKANILNICIVVTKVHLPCLMISVTTIRFLKKL